MLYLVVLGEPSSCHSSLWKGYAVLSEVRNKLFASFSTAAVVSFRYRSGMETIRVPLLWVCVIICTVCVVCVRGLVDVY